MKIFVLAAIVVFVQPTFAAMSCADAAADRATIIRDMADFYLHVTSIPDAAEKSRALSEFKLKLAEIIEKYGSSSKDEILASAASRREQRVQEKEDEALKEKETREAEAEAIHKWSRLDELPDTKVLGDFISDNEVYLAHRGKLSVYNINTKQATPVRGADGIELDSFSKILSSPHHELVVTVVNEDVSIINTKTGKVISKHIPTQHKRGFRASKFSKNGEYLFLAGEDGETLIYSVHKNEFVFSKTTHDYPHGHMIVESPDGRYVFVPRSDDKQVLYDMQQRKEIVLPNLKAANIYHAWDGGFSADSKTLTFVNHNGEIYNFDIATRELDGSRFGAFRVSRESLFTTLDNRWLVATGTKTPANGKVPFVLIDMVTGLEQQTALKDHKFENPTNVRQEGDFIYFTDTLREADDQQILYMFNLKTFTLHPYMLPADVYFFQLYGFSPDMKSLLVRGNGGPLYRVH